MIREGDRRKSILTGRVYRVTTLKEWSVVLETLDGSSRVYTEKDNLKLFYENLENEEPPEDFASSLVPKVEMH